MSLIFKKTCVKYGIRKIRITSPHSHSEGKFGRFNRSQEKFSRNFLSYQRKDFLVCRSTIQNSNSNASIKIVFGNELRLSGVLKFGVQPIPVTYDRHNTLEAPFTSYTT